MIMSRRCRALSRSRRNVCILRYDSMSLRLRCLRSLYLCNNITTTRNVKALRHQGFDPWIACVSPRCGAVGGTIPLLLSWSEDEVWVGVVDGGDGPELAEQRLLEPLALAHPIAIHLLHHLQDTSTWSGQYTNPAHAGSRTRTSFPSPTPYWSCMCLCVCVSLSGWASYLSVGPDCLKVKAGLGKRCLGRQRTHQLHRCTTHTRQLNT